MSVAETAIPTIGDTSPEDPRRTYQMLACTRPGCGWRWSGYLPPASSPEGQIETERIVAPHRSRLHRGS